MDDQMNQIRRHDLRLLLISAREQNARAKMLINMITSQVHPNRLPRSRLPIRTC
jgi:hypothetical protein